jgi:hypothetical protein
MRIFRGRLLLDRFLYGIEIGLSRFGKGSHQADQIGTVEAGRLIDRTDLANSPAAALYEKGLPLVAYAVHQLRKVPGRLGSGYSRPLLGHNLII